MVLVGWMAISGGSLLAVGCKSAKQSVRRGTLEQQRVCAEQARKEFESSYPHPQPGDRYVSHCDPDANVCYMMVVSSGFSPVTGPFMSMQVSDAFERRVLAMFSRVGQEGKKSEVDQCSVYPRNRQEGIGCESQNQFNILVDQYFGISE